MKQKTRKITAWVLITVLAFLFAMSAFMKLTLSGEAVAQAASAGMDASTYRFIGIIELAALVLFIIPRTGVVGTLLLIAYMGGAIVTHLQHNQPVVVAVVVQTLVWVTAFIRFPELNQRLFLLNRAYDHDTAKHR